MAQLGFGHRWVPAERAGAPTLLLLHGTGGDEDDLIPLGHALVPGAALLSPRGQVSEGGSLRFFRRLAEGVFDQVDLAKRTEELASFVRDAAQPYAIDLDRLITLGFSNGANIAASVILRDPGLLRTNVLLSPMVPFEPDATPGLAGTSVFLGAGRRDPIAPTSQVERLGEIFREGGADVTVHWHDAGHTITQDEFDAARQWVASVVP